MKRCLSMLLMLAMLAGMLVVPVHAEEGEFPALYAADSSIFYESEDNNTRSTADYIDDETTMLGLTGSPQDVDYFYIPLGNTPCSYLSFIIVSDSPKLIFSLESTAGTILPSAYVNYPLEDGTYMGVFTATIPAGTFYPVLRAPESDGNVSYLLYHDECTATYFYTHPSNRTAVVGTSAQILASSVTDETSTTHDQWQVRYPGGEWRNLYYDGGAMYVAAEIDGTQYRMVTTGVEGIPVYSKVATVTVKPSAPIIISQPQDVPIASKSEKAVFTLEAAGDNLTYQWQYRSSGSHTWKDATATGNKTPTLTLDPVGSRSQNYYRCKVTNSYGSTYTTAARPRLISKAPVFKYQFKDIITLSSPLVTFQVDAQASGTAVSYQWQYRTSPEDSWKNCTESCANSYYFRFKPDGFTQAGYQYRCIASNLLGTIYTEPITLNFSKWPVVYEQPKKQTAGFSGSATFSVASYGTDLKYQWQYSAPDSSSWINIDCTESTLTLHNIQTWQNEYTYRCVISSAHGSTTSNSAFLYVHDEPVFRSISPKSTPLPYGEDLILTADVSGATSLQWQCRISPMDEWYDVTIPGSNTNTLTIDSVDSTHNGLEFRCVATGPKGTSASSVYRLFTVPPVPVLTSQPVSRTADPVDSVSFSVSASETTDYQWYCRSTICEPWTKCTLPGSQTDTLTINPVGTNRNGYQYACLISGPGGYIFSEPATLTVTEPRPVVTTQPKRVNVLPSGKAVFSITAEGNNLTYQWQYRKDASDGWKNATASGSKTDTLTIDPAGTTRNGYQYRCAVTNAGGTTYSSYATLVIIPKPAITSQPVSQTVPADEAVTFSVTATGADSYQWQYKVPGSTKWLSNDCTDAVLTIDPAKNFRDGYQYRCKVTNGSGTTYSDAATLTVIAPKPAITSQPVSQTVGAADSVTFSVTATGADSYQWQYMVSGGTKWFDNDCTDAVLTIDPAKNFRNGYQYRCKVTNGSGTTYSDAATLSIIPKPAITAQPVSQTVPADEAVTFSVTATGADSYQWQYMVPGSTKWLSNDCTDAVLTIDPARAWRNGYQYRCAVTNGSGTTYSDAATLTVN